MHPTLLTGAPAPRPQPPSDQTSRGSARRAVPTAALSHWPTSAAYLAALLALVPMLGWLAALPSLAAGLSGWTPIPPATALGLLAAAAALALSDDDPLAPWRRYLAGALGAAIVVGAVGALLLPAPLRLYEPAELVLRWHAEPLLLRQASTSLAGAVGLLLLGAAMVLLVVPGTSAARGAQLAGGGVALVALLGAAPPAAMAVGAAEAQVAGRATTVSPVVALVLVLLASGVLLARGAAVAWGVDARSPVAAVVRYSLPPLLVAPPALVWLAELAERRRLLNPGDARTLLLLGLAVVAALTMAHLALRLHAVTDAGREREQRRARRQARREAEYAALQAEQVTRLALDRYRTNLRGILELAPAPFVALDGLGVVLYANAAACALFQRPAERVVGFPIAHAWPSLGDAVQRTLDDADEGEVIEAAIPDPHTGGTVALRGLPGEEGYALFLSRAGHD